MAPLINNLASVIKNLNANIDIDVVDVTDPRVNKTCGTYALIDKITSDLALIENNLKKAENNIEKVLLHEITTRGNVVGALDGIKLTTKITTNSIIF